MNRYIRKDVAECVIETGKKLIEYGLVSRTWGNISARVDDKHMIITPSGRSYLNLEVDDLCTVNLKTGEYKCTAGYRPSSEWHIHNMIMNLFPDTNMIIHTHQKWATVISVLGDIPSDYAEFDGNTEFLETRNTILKENGFYICRYAPSGSEELCGNLQKCLEGKMYDEKRKMIFLARHGVICWGESQSEIFENLEEAEKISKKQVMKYISEDEFSECVDKIENKETKFEPVIDDACQMIGNLETSLCRDDDQEDFKAFTEIYEKNCWAMLMMKKLKISGFSKDYAKSMRKKFLDSYCLLKK